MKPVGSQFNTPYFLCKSQNFNGLERIFFSIKTQFFKLDLDWAELGETFGSGRQKSQLDGFSVGVQVIGQRETLAKGAITRC